MNDFHHCHNAPSSSGQDQEEYSDSLLPLSRHHSLPAAENSAAATTSSDGIRIGKARSYTEEEIMLASSHPKKPTGRKKFKETRHPVYRGVRRRNSNRWVCEVREPNKKNRIWLGTYPTAEMAARAHDVAAQALRGTKGCLNFADSAWRLPVPASTDPEDIQRAAAEAAEMFKPKEYEEENLNKLQSMMNDTPFTSADVSAEDNNNSNNTISGNNNNNNINEETNYGGECEQAGTTTTVLSSSYSYYLDDEAVFNMPGLLNSMAEGLLLPPPPQPSYHPDTEDDTDMTLWDHSF